MTTPDQPERCATCGFVWEHVPREEVGPRVAAGTAALADLLTAVDPAVATARRTPGEWSALEYGAHVRDVLYHLRDRLVIGISEDGATFKPLYREQRVDAGLYAADEPHVVAAELTLAGPLYARTFDALDDDQLARLGEYTYPVQQWRTLLWIGQQAVHEVEHHLADARRCVT